MPAVSVLMPTFEQAAFLPRAVASLQRQSLGDWELVIVDDGSQDDTAAAVAPFLTDRRIALHRLPRNRGLGAALNHGLERARGELIAYLPSDDVLFPEHLATLAALMEPGVTLAATAAEPEASPLALVRHMHRRGPERWVEREELETDDLGRLLLDRLRARGREAVSPAVTCAWTQHPGQRHRAIRHADDGGLNVFRSRYRVAEPLRFAPSDGEATDERRRYRHLAGAPPPRAGEGLRILLVGELAYNPDRIALLEARGHELLGLWTPDPLGWTTVGPLPFGGVRDLPLHGWREAVRAAQPDVVYALLNWRSVPLAHAVLRSGLGLPFVFHFKEAPQRCLLRGEWPLLADLLAESDACLLASPEERAWVLDALPGRADPARVGVMDGDLPHPARLAGTRAPRRPGDDGEVHTALLGRPYGFGEELLAGLAARGIRVHVHRGPSAVAPEDWVRVLSRYDAGWLHPVRAANEGDIARATWDELNLPARLPTLLLAGLPVILPRSEGVHAAQAATDREGVAVLYDDLDDLAGRLRDRAGMAARGDRAWAVRERFTFGHEAGRLEAILRAVAARAPLPAGPASDQLAGTSRSLPVSTS